MTLAQVATVLVVGRPGETGTRLMSEEWIRGEVSRVDTDTVHVASVGLGPREGASYMLMG